LNIFPNWDTLLYTKSISQFIHNLNSIPIHFNNIIVGVLDIDSPIIKRFSTVDQEGLEELVRILEDGCDWTNQN